MLSQLAAWRGMLTWDYGMSVTLAEIQVDIMAYLDFAARPMVLAAHLISRVVGDGGKGKGRSRLAGRTSQAIDPAKHPHLIASSFAAANMSQPTNERRGTGVVTNRDQMPRGRPVSASDFEKLARAKMSGKRRVGRPTPRR